MLIKYGSFIQTIFDFTIIAIVLFMRIKGINKSEETPHRRSAAAPATAEARSAPGRDSRLLARRA